MTRIDHTGHATPKARAACRKALAPRLGHVRSYESRVTKA